MKGVAAFTRFTRKDIAKARRLLQRTIELDPGCVDPYTMLANTFVMEYTQWEPKYHVIFIPKYRRKVLYGTLRRHMSRFERFRWMPPALPGE